MGAYQLKITIKGSKPPIWRRILVPEGITFENLHQIIQTAFCWSGEHLYQFEFRSEGIRIVPDKENGSPKFQTLLSDEKIDELVSGMNKFTYTYPIGDNLEHVIQAEDMTEAYAENYAQVIKYKGDKTTGEYDMSAVNKRLKKIITSQSGEKVHLADIFDCYDKNSITEIARRHEMKGFSKLKKEELIERTVAHIIDKKAMRRYFLCVRDAEIKAFDRIIEGDHKVASFESEDMDFLYAGGYVTAGSSHDFLVAEEVKSTYKELNTPEFKDERGRISKIGDYLCAANALYAITPPSVLLETFNKYEEKKLTADELQQAYELLLPYRCMVKYIDGYFVDAALAEQKSFYDFKRMQKKVPYYIPTQQEIRFMADNAGFLMTSELSQLSRFLKDEANVPDEMIPYVLRQVQAEIGMGGQLQEVMDDMEAAGIIFESDAQADKFAAIITEVWNHTRMVLNRGHKPFEMVMKGLEEVSAQRKNIQKVYPNAACPCGSGKKYKKCCGKRS